MLSIYKWQLLIALPVNTKIIQYSYNARLIGSLGANLAKF